jgi:hypothetical protein
MDYFKLTRAFWDFAFENPEKIKPNHCAMYLFIVEHCNRLGWKEKFGLPTTMVKDAIGIRSYNTYIETLNDLVDFGLITMIEKSKNQYSSNIVAISNFDKAHTKALDKATLKHDTKQSESIVQSTSSINKQDTNNNIPSIDKFLSFAISEKPLIDQYSVRAKYDAWIQNEWKDGNGKKIKNWKTKLKNTLPYLKENNTKTHKNEQLTEIAAAARINNPKL